MKERKVHYPDGARIRVGDRVLIDGVALGRVVISCDDGDYELEFPKEDWTSLKRGILVLFDNGARLHIPDLHSPGEGPPIIQKVCTE